MVASVIFELSDQKARCFLVLIDLTRWFLKHVYKVFVEISSAVFSGCITWFRGSIAFL
jgi:hypothetical protein